MTEEADRSTPVAEVSIHHELTPERERWAEASTLLRLYGDGAPAFIATRIGLCATMGDQEGIDRLREIADRMDKLMRPDVIQ